MKEKEDTSTSRTTGIICNESLVSFKLDWIGSPYPTGNPAIFIRFFFFAWQLNCWSVSIPNQGGAGWWLSHCGSLGFHFISGAVTYARQGPAKIIEALRHVVLFATSRADAVASGVARRARRAPPSDAIARSARNRFQILGVRLWPTGGVGSGPCLKIERRPVRGATAFDGGTRVSAGGGRAAVRAPRRGR